MIVSEDALEVIKHFEGCELESYRCPADVWTIGYGHTGDVTENQIITESQAENLLKTDVSRFEEGVTDLVEVDLEQHQFDALVSFAYNLGLGNLGKSTLLRKLNEGDFEGAADEFPKWRKAAGVVLAGLVRRRGVEKTLFEDGIVDL